VSESDRPGIRAAGRPRVVLVGAGHAHQHALRHAAEYGRHGIELVAVAPTAFWYSGLATGVLGGRHAPERDRIDVGGCARRSGARHFADRVTRVDTGARRVELAGGEVLDYDLVSFAVGSIADTLPREPGATHAWPVKPIERIVELRAELERRFAARGMPRVLVVGGGASGCEVAANIAELARIHGARTSISLAAGTARLLPAHAPAAGDRVARHLQRLGIELQFETRVASTAPGGARRADGAIIAADIVIAATGLRPPPLLREAGLAVDSLGALRIDAQLRSISDPRIFAGGDCAVLDATPLPRIGVVAVRQGPILHANLIATATGRTPRRYRPQKRFLLILNLGAARGLALRGSRHWYGRSALWLKDFIDLRYLAALRASCS
jgi:NADH dehydrogenase FAD-containing subunit